MPVIVVGADTPQGMAIVTALAQPSREVRAFVTDVTAAESLRSMGVKVALGDVSDEGHIEAAATRCFTAVLIAESAFDGRERSFASTSEEVLEGWARAVATARVHRAIWVIEGTPPPTAVKESVSVAVSDPDVVDRVVALDEAQYLT